MQILSDIIILGPSVHSTTHHTTTPWKLHVQFYVQIASMPKKQATKKRSMMLKHLTIYTPADFPFRLTVDYTW